MATVTGVISAITGQTLQGVAGPNASGPYNWQTPGYIRGELKVNVDYYVGLGTEAAGTVIKMFPLLDVGAMILYHQITTSAATSSLTISVGDLDSATRYASASTGPASAGLTIIASKLNSTSGFYLIGTNPATPTATDTDAQIILTTGGATLGTGTIYALTTFFVAD